ncbi:MAG TPA: chalcone isomerase family protein [Thermoanaerobaculia bacterium]|jgi:hypothetical protein|nr:chalcone isomerase family protein [Thermoanaerobaculia bacterium]
MRRFAALALCLLPGLLLTAPLAAKTVAGVSMPESVKVDDHELVLNGVALRSKAIFKVYVGGLYLPDKEHDWKKVLGEDEPRHMVMQWVRNVDKAKICEAWDEGLEANTPGASPEIKKNFETLCSYMQDAREGDKFTFTYIPGKGTDVAINGQAKGTLGSKPFADALFACWIGAHPGPGETFRDALMGN